MSIFEFVLFGLILINVAVFLYSISSAQARSMVISQFGVIPSAIKNGEYYRLVTSAFVHNDIFHIFLNMYSLFVLFEPVISVLRLILPEQFVLLGFLGLYFASSVTAGLVSAGRSNSMTPSIGASGAIFGLLGFLLTIGLATMSGIVSIGGLNGGYLVQNILFVIAINFGIGLMPGLNIDNRGHFGGLIGGVVVGAVLIVLAGVGLLS